MGNKVMCTRLDSTADTDSEGTYYNASNAWSRNGEYDKFGQKASAIIKESGSAWLYLGARQDGMRARNKRNPLKITHLLCLEQSGRYPEEGSKLNFLMEPMDDCGGSNLSAVVSRVSDFVEQTMEDPKARLLIHCTQGLNRGPTIVIWYLIKYRGMTYDQALSMVLDKRDDVRLVKSYEQGLRAFEKTGAFPKPVAQLYARTSPRISKCFADISCDPEEKH